MRLYRFVRYRRHSQCHSVVCFIFPQFPSMAQPHRYWMTVPFGAYSELEDMLTTNLIITGFRKRMITQRSLPDFIFKSGPISTTGNPDTWQHPQSRSQLSLDLTRPARTASWPTGPAAFSLWFTTAGVCPNWRK